MATVLWMSLKAMSRRCFAICISEKGDSELGASALFGADIPSPQTGRPEAKSILHPDLRNIPSQPAVQLIGNGPISDPEVLQGLPAPCQLKHPSYETFHKTLIDKASASATSPPFTRFYRFHIVGRPSSSSFSFRRSALTLRFPPRQDAAHYERDPPKVTTLYALKTPEATM